MKGVHFCIFVILLVTYNSAAEQKIKKEQSLTISKLMNKMEYLKLFPNTRENLLYVLKECGGQILGACNDDTCHECCPYYKLKGGQCFGVWQNLKFCICELI
uniref:Uncharacterized protein LOC114325351 n=1 Tax=Diabrotica virgifera virgifera TaxID=50390 RepID=A0A6P7F2V1_DIAVI